MKWNSIITSQLIKFGWLRVASFFLSLFFMHLFHVTLSIEERTAYAMVLLILLIISYFISAIWVFHTTLTKRTFFQYFGYIGLISIISVPLFDFLSSKLHVNYLFNTIISLGLVFVLKFIVLKNNVFK